MSQSILNNEEGAYVHGLNISTLSTELSIDIAWVVIRGIFDAYGSFSLIKTRLCKISVSDKLASYGLTRHISNLCRIKNTHTDNTIIFTGVNAVDFLSKLYDNSDVKYRSKTNYNIYLKYLNYKERIPKCQYVKVDKNAIGPTKNNASDEGYDLWLINIDKVISENTIRYDTGISIQPEDGFHIELLPRSSLSNSGYMLSNSIGLIDESYRGTLKICLTKVNPQAKELELPNKAVQMVLRRSMHFLCNEVESLDNTERGSGGFGSTDVKK